MKMMDEGVDVWREGRRHDFFPGELLATLLVLVVNRVSMIMTNLGCIPCQIIDADEAVGAPVAVLSSQFPFLYSGSARNGCPVGYFLAGQVSVEGIECVTELGNITNLLWHIMMYQFPGEVARAQEKNPDVVR